MRIVAAYALVFYGVLTVASVKLSVRHGRMAAGGGLVQALDGITMIFAAFGVLLGLGLGLGISIVSVVVASLLAGYHVVLVGGVRALRGQTPRTVLAVVLIALLVLG